MHVTYTRAEWSAIADKVAASDPALIPPGLSQRITELLEATPESWPDQICILELTPENAAAVRLISQQIHMVTGAEQILHDHQQGNATASYRIEHRDSGVSSVVMYLTNAGILRQELVRQRTRLRADGATGELVLVHQESHEDIARLRL